MSISLVLGTLLLAGTVIGVPDCVIVSHGDVYIDIILSVYHNENGSCGTVDPESVQQLEAVRWALQNIQETSDMPDITIGLRAHRTCRSTENAAMVAATIAYELTTNNSRILGPEFSSEAMVVSSLLGALPEKHRLPQIGYSTSVASLSDRNLYRNFFRVIPPDNIQISAMERLMVAMNWTYFAAVYDDDAYGREGVASLEKLSKMEGICLTKKILIDTRLSNQETILKLQETLISLMNKTSPILGFVVFGGTKLASNFLHAVNKSINDLPAIPLLILSEAAMNVGTFSLDWPTVLAGSFVLSPPVRKIEKFATYWTSLFHNQTTHIQDSNPWLLDVFKLWSSQSSRHENGTTEELNSVLASSTFVHYAVQATVVLAETIKRVRGDTCKNDDKCPSFFNISRFQLIKKLANIKVDLAEFPIFIKSLESISVFFNGSVDALPQQGSTSYVVFNCQKNIDGTRENCFKEVGSYHRLSNKLNLLNHDIKDYEYPGYAELSWNETRKGQCKNGSVCTSCIIDNPNHVYIIPGELYIVAVVPVHVRGSSPMQCGDVKIGGVDIVEAIDFAIRQSKFQPGVERPIVSVGAIIIDSCIHPMIIKERILTLYRYGIRNDDGSYSQIMMRVIGFIAAWSSDISISVAEILTETRHVQIAYGSTAPILSNRTKYPYFLRLANSDILQIKLMLDIMKDIGANYEWLVPSLDKHLETYEFIFIASEEWGTRPILKDVKNLIGTITVSTDLPVNQKFREHMLNLRTTGEDANPWLQTFMEKELKCHFQWSFNKISSKSCRIDEGLKNDYKIDSWVPLVENAVYALLTGASRTLKKQCGQTSSICDNYRAHVMELVEEIKQVQLDMHGTGNREDIFDQNGDGILAYIIYMVQKQAGEVKYRRLGQSLLFYFVKNLWKNSTNFTGESDLKCGQKTLCSVCFQEQSSEPQTSSYIGFLYSTIALIILCSVSVVAVVFLIIQHRRKGRTKIVGFVCVGE
ncbi:hypothetical protein CHS0354_003300 [Potamilus streckersoni]|uniref:Receptor ligand binding region domain-containing protein n=1 Tax=Potamilus streckersoni TaxID=2493646 RepID=A0AAE0S599_9BIVA|nr:hypothetical protein CHS0354_003300 [Potamilus streckersoni]